MLRRSARLALAGALVLAAFLVPVAAIAGHGPGSPKPGKGNGRAKATLCHKGHTIRVGLPALRAHLRHGDTLGPCGQRPSPGTATITVLKHVVNDNGGTRVASDFTLTINGVTAAGGNTLAGSEAGVVKTITTFGSYSVTEAAAPGYVTGASAGCTGTIAPGQQKVCIVTNDDAPAKLTVVKHVIDDNGGTKKASDFTLTVNGVTAIGGNTFAGSESGVTRTLSSLGSYSVTEIAVPGYALKSASADCSGTIALGQSKTCTITNDDV